MTIEVVDNVMRSCISVEIAMVGVISMESPIDTVVKGMVADTIAIGAIKTEMKAMATSRGERGMKVAFIPARALVKATKPILILTVLIDPPQRDLAIAINMITDKGPL